MSDWLERLSEWARLVQAVPLVRSVGHAALVYLGFFVVVLAAEWRSGADTTKYRTRHFLNDIVYTLFYRGGFYNVLLLAAVTNAMDARLGFLRLDPFRGLPWYVGLAVYWIAGDFVMYWWHRFQHGNRFMWALHSVHHSQERLNLLSASRRHPLENLMLDVLIFFGIFHFVLGIPTRAWMPLSAAITCVLAIQHADVDWRLGPLYRLIVSPRFHSFHHSTDPAHANANYGFLFSTWDYLFGTAVADQARPRRYGVDGVDFGESLLRQLVTPFALMWRWRRRPQAPEPASAPEAGAPHALRR